MKKATTEQIIAAYKQTGTVWGAAKSLGMAGQTIWGRLRAIGYPMHSMRWTEAELIELRALVSQCTIGEISRRLGRPYSGVASKISSLRVGVRFGNNRAETASRKFDRETVDCLLGELEVFSGSARQFCMGRSLSLDPFVKAAQRFFLERWNAWAIRHTNLPPKECPNCFDQFVPMTKKQITCSRKCQYHYRNNAHYFGGQRNNTIGLAEGICQLCLKQSDSLSSHHLIGRENDPQHQQLIALCTGCHNIVGLLAAREFLEDASGWERLIGFVLARRMFPKNNSAAVNAYVEIDYQTADELIEEIAESERVA